MNQQGDWVDFDSNNSAPSNSNFGGQNLWGRGRGWLQGTGRGRGPSRGAFNNNNNNNNVSRNYAPAQLQRQQQMEHALLNKLHVDSSSEPEMDKSLKTWKCEQCSLINQLYYLKCLGCKSFLSTYIRVGILIQLLKHYMPEYSNYNNNQFNFSTLFASNLNRLYLVVINKNGAFNNSNNDVDRFVLRIFKPMSLSQRKKLDECYNLFNQLNIGPKVFARFEIGHIEEHIDGKKIYHDKQRTEQVWKTVIDKMFQIQNITPNEQIFSKENDTFDAAVKHELDVMRKYINIDKNELKLEGFEFTGKDLKTIGEIVTLFPDGVDSMMDEYNWLNNSINELWKQLSWENRESPMVFSHNDIYQGNIMEVFSNDQVRQQMSQLSGQELDQFVSSNYGGDIKIIDYETCCWNNRYYDLANWLIELCVEYFRVPNYPYVTIDWNKYPNEQFREQVGRYYLSKLTNQREDEIKDQDVRMLLKMIDLNSLLCDFYQGIKAFNYGIIGEHEGNTVVRGAKRRYNEPEQIRMDYFEYSVQRLKNYWYSKNQIVGFMEDEKQVEQTSNNTSIKDSIIDAISSVSFQITDGFNPNKDEQKADIVNNRSEQMKDTLDNITNTLIGDFSSTNKQVLSQDETQTNNNTLLSSSIVDQAKETWNKVSDQITTNVNTETLKSSFDNVKNTLGFNNENKEKEELKDYQNIFIEKYVSDVPEQTKQSWSNVNNEIKNNNNLSSSLKHYVSNVSGQVKETFNNSIDQFKNTLGFNNNNTEEKKDVMSIVQNYNTDMTTEAQQTWNQVNNEIKHNNETNILDQGAKFANQVASNVSSSFDQLTKNINTETLHSSLQNTANKVKDTLGFNNTTTTTQESSFSQAKQPLMQQAASSDFSSYADDKTKQAWNNVNNEIKNTSSSTNNYQTDMSKEAKQTWDKITNEIKNNNQTGLLNQSTKLAKKVVSNVTTSLNQMTNINTETLQESLQSTANKFKDTLGFNNNNNNTPAFSQAKVPLMQQPIVESFNYTNDETKQTWNNVDIEIKTNSYESEMSEEAKRTWNKVTNEIKGNNNENGILNQSTKFVKEVASNVSSSLGNTVDKFKDTLGFNNDNDNKSEFSRAKEPLMPQAVESNDASTTKQTWNNVDIEIKTNSFSTDNYGTDMSKDAKEKWDKINNEIKNNNKVLNKGVKLAKVMVSNVSNSLNQITNVNTQPIQTSFQNTVNKVKDTLGFNNNNTADEAFSQAKQPIMPQAATSDFSSYADDETKQAWNNVNNEIKDTLSSTDNYQTSMSKEAKKAWDKVANEIKGNNNNKTGTSLNKSVKATQQFVTDTSQQIKQSLGNAFDKVKNTLDFTDNKSKDIMEKETRDDGTTLYLIPTSEKAQAFFNAGNDDNNNNTSNITSTLKESVTSVIDKAKESLGFGNKNEAGVYSTEAQQPIVPQAVEQADRPTFTEMTSFDDNNRNEKDQSKDFFGDVTNKFSDNTDFGAKKQENKINIDEPQERTL